MTAFITTQPNGCALEGLIYATIESECVRIEAQPVFPPRFLCVSVLREKRVPSRLYT